MKSTEYIPGWYRVTSFTKNYKSHVEIFQTEEEARFHGNEQWKLPFVIEVSISKMRYVKCKRSSIIIAKAIK